MYYYTVKKGLPLSRPQPGCHLPNSPWRRIILLFPVRESLVSDIPAGDGNSIIFFTVYSMFKALAAAHPGFLHLSNCLPMILRVKVYVSIVY